MLQNVSAIGFQKVNKWEMKENPGNISGDLISVMIVLSCRNHQISIDSQYIVRKMGY